MTRRLKFFIAFFISLSALALHAAESGNLLRNSKFQDDWITFLPETKNHHWCYSSEFYNRRDYNPDTWICKGSWQWLNADGPYGERRMILKGPDAQVSQRVNWVAVQNDRKVEGFPDAGGFPAMQLPRSQQPLRLVRDLTLRVRVKGTDVPEKAAVIKVGLCPPGAVSSGDPMGSQVAPTASQTVALPAGTYDWQWVEVKLEAAAWLQAAKDAAAKNPKDAEELAKSGVPLPGTVSVAISYKGAVGQIEIADAELLEVGLPDAANLLANGGFEKTGDDGYPSGWDPPVKYHYFPPGWYYIFNTWHNSNIENRGPVRGDSMIGHKSAGSLQMIVAAGDEKSVSSKPVVLKQKEPRFIEVSAWVKTDRLCTLQIDALNEKNERLDGFRFIHKAPVSVGTDEWRLVRQVFKPTQPVESLRLMLCARGVNGYTLDDTGAQPQNNVVGTIWWDDVRVFEPESTVEELAARGIPFGNDGYRMAQMLECWDLELGERMLGKNELKATFYCIGVKSPISLQWELTAPSGTKSVFRSEPVIVPAQGSAQITVPYTITELCTNAYTEYHTILSLLDGDGERVKSTTLWFGTWTTPIDLELGALYLLPEQKQFVRMNFGLSQAELKKLKGVRLEIIRRGTGQAVHATVFPAGPAEITAQREKIPSQLREDFTNLLLADLDVDTLPVQPFNDPQRNWFIRASALDAAGKVVASADSQPFCRLAHEPPQLPIEKVNIDARGLLYVNGKPWMPFGVVYGFVPVYEGPAAIAKDARDLHNLPEWSIYDRFGSAPYTRSRNDFNCLRYVAGSITKTADIEKHWTGDNLYCSSAFVAPQPVWSEAELTEKAGGAEKLAALLAAIKTSPAIVSSAPGIEEAFGLFHSVEPAKIAGMAQAVEAIRKATGKPVMTGHGGYWNRFEFERAPFFDIYDPETEPFFPANLHTDLLPLIAGKEKTIWLRPQMYEDVPYERWRFHVWVELMRGARGWQIAHGPGDQSLFRGLHAEMELIKPAVYSAEPAPKVEIAPWIEHWSRRHNGKTFIVAATTHGLTHGHWRWNDEKSPGGRSRVTEVADEMRTEVDGYAIGRPLDRGLAAHSIENLPDARAWPEGSKLVQWVRVDPKMKPRNLTLLAKVDGRWTHAASWGEFKIGVLREDLKLAYWFLKSFHRHFPGFLGWDDKLVPKALEYIPGASVAMGELPAAGEWFKLEVPLEKIAADKKLLDGIGFMHEGGRVAWGRTSIVDPAGAETLVWGDSIGLSPGAAEKVTLRVEGLKAGTKVRVLFEDREITAAEGSFIDDFRGQDFYQRFGGGWGVGYGDAPVALHIYEVP